jgi:hypothetical protein
MRAIPYVLALLLMAGPAWSATLDGAAITEALAGHRFAYDDGTSQLFATDGWTLFFARDGSDSIGHWRVEGDQYCSVWPPSDHWACYAVTQDAGRVGFVSGDGSVSLARRTD